MKAKKICPTNQNTQEPIGSSQMKTGTGVGSYTYSFVEILLNFQHFLDVFPHFGKIYLKNDEIRCEMQTGLADSRSDDTFPVEHNFRYISQTSSSSCRASAQ